MNETCRNPKHREERFPLHDVAGIFVAYVCDACEKAVKNRYAPHVFGDSLTEYMRVVAESGEAIEPEDY